MYLPTIPGNAIFAGLFGLFIIVQLFLGIKHKTWGFMTALCMGLVLECVGYIARVLMHDDPFNGDWFLMSLVVLTIAPAFITAGVYLCLARIISVYGEHLSRFKPRTYTIVFVTCDFICLVLQGLGGGIAASADTKKSSDLGKNIMMAGLIFQVVSLALFGICCGEFALRVLRGRGSRNERYTAITSSLLFKGFLVALFVACITILIRSLYRCVELSGGFNSDLFTGDEALFMVLEGVMIVLATGGLSVFHPAVAFQGVWHELNFNFRTKKSHKAVSMTDEESPMTNVELIIDCLM
ncbi:putative Sphingoid long-chain base transporter RSB1 [Glarea lozoyensis 74030]|uniref:Putative Sphingoid long-chain base transporter RSB1 n=1 Tax=Glarea lozoyensis (strain ATCC 74030 / MF5533) TaxID=1104152 RepID=H0EK09_GLAL7|nr:putative Sphingoid long-chain base transporter RSB1 [Glarea lozoyensis 74030]